MLHTGYVARRSALVLVTIAAATACAGRANSEGVSRFEEAVRAQIEARVAAPDGNALEERLSERDALARFYTGRGGAPAWLQRGELRDDLVRELLDALRQSERHGLRPNDYHAEALARALDRRDLRTADELASLEVLLSDAFVHLARHLAEGAIDPRALDPDFERAPGPALDTARVLAAAIESGRIGDALARTAPPHPEYDALVRALERQREAQSAGDAAAESRADRVRANLERWRWAPRELGRRHLRVNVASFLLEAFDAGQARFAMRVVVGEKDWNTPVAHGVISHLVLNPAWQVPRSIATREMLPAARRDRGYFRAKGIQVLVDEKSRGTRQIDPSRIDWRKVSAASFPYRLRQQPGPHNPLGRIKFVFANPYGVYLHGTPGDLAFARGVRTLSHGCVRVEDEIALAEFALAPDSGWTHERLLETLRSAWEHRLPLPEPLPVHLLYFTASATPDGAVAIGADPYGWDRALIAALRTAPSAQGSIATGVPTSLRSAMKSMSASASPMQP